jgi:hypothetical protein
LNQVHHGQEVLLDPRNVGEGVRVRKPFLIILGCGGGGGSVGARWLKCDS